MLARQAAAPSVGGAGADLSANPIIYFLLTDRFCGGAPGPAAALDGAPGSFFGGRLAGVTRKLEEGWFSALGVNALWISAPYQQILGWVPGDGGFRHYAYHGYWPLDYTVLDQRVGTEDDLQALVSAAHRRGIKVILDIVISHPGYPEATSLASLLPQPICASFAAGPDAAPVQGFDASHPHFESWWGSDWVDFGSYVHGAEEGEAIPSLPHGLPRFRSDRPGAVRPPAFLLGSPTSRAAVVPGASVEDYLVGWLCDWVRRFGIDGFRCDSVKHVGRSTWRKLKAAATQALADWKQGHPLSRPDLAPFWMTGEVYGHGIERSAYFDAGFDSVINFQFQVEFGEISRALQPENRFSRQLYGHRLDQLYQRYADRLAGRDSHNVLSFISSHDTGLFDRNNLIEAGTALLLVPGGVQIFYGDETARPQADLPGLDAGQSARSAMNWTQFDTAVLAHWRTLGQFRARHVSICRGRHRKVRDFPYTFVRDDAESGDRVLVVIGYCGPITLDVREIFPDGCLVRDAQTHASMRVALGEVRCHVEQVLLLELVDTLNR